MTPPRPHSQAFRALAAAHPGVDEEILHRIESLTHERFRVDPETDPERLKQIDKEREDLIRKHFPNFHEVTHELNAHAGFVPQVPPPP